MWQSNNFCRIFNHLSQICRQICRQIWPEFHIMSKQLHSLAGALIVWVQWDNYNQACDLVQYLIRGFVCRVLSALHVAVVQVVKQRHSTTQTTEANEHMSYNRLLWQQTFRVDASFSAHSDDGSQQFSIGKTQGITSVIHQRQADKENINNIPPTLNHTQLNP